MFNRLHQPKLITVIKYCDTKTISPGASSAYHSFRLNSIQDPDYTGGGHQPAYTDQWGVLYTRYRVLKATWSISFAANRTPTYAIEAVSGNPYSDTIASTQNQSRTIVGCEYNDLLTSNHLQSGDKNFVREAGGMMKDTSWRYLPAGLGAQAVIKGGVTLRELYDSPDNYLRSTAWGSNPKQEDGVTDLLAMLHVAALSKDSNTTCPVRFDITLKYTVELSEPVNIGES